MTTEERIAAIVERSTREQGLDLEVRDPVALHRIAVLILGTNRPASSPEQAA